MRRFSMKGQRGKKCAFLLSPLCGYVVDAVLHKFRNATEAMVEGHIAEVLKNVLKSKVKGEDEQNEEKNDEENDEISD